MKVWMRGRSASRTASAARSTSAAWARARPAMTGPSTWRAIALHGLEVARRGDREAGLDDVDAEARELVGDLELLGRVQRDAGRLLAVAQRGVEDDDPVGVGGGRHGWGPCRCLGVLFVLVRGFRRPPRAAIPPAGGGEGEAGGRDGGPSAAQATSGLRTRLSRADGGGAPGDEALAAAHADQRAVAAATADLEGHRSRARCGRRGAAGDALAAPQQLDGDAGRPWARG